MKQLILVVDDNVVRRDALRTCLQSSSFDVAVLYEPGKLMARRGTAASADCHNERTQLWQWSHRAADAARPRRRFAAHHARRRGRGHRTHRGTRMWC